MGERANRFRPIAIVVVVVATAVAWFWFTNPDVT